MKRGKHSLSHYKLLSCDMGQLIPVSTFEVLPGDSVRQATSALIRVSPLARPVMHPVTVRLHHWFVPYRLLWSEWEQFITGGTDGEGDGSIFPRFSLAVGAAAGDVLDYMGVAPGIPLSISALPVRAYNLIFNEYYRDQDLVPERTVALTGAVDTTTTLGAPAQIAWEKDYFTAARPWTQRGPEVTLPLGLTAPIQSTGVLRLDEDGAGTNVGDVIREGAVAASQLSINAAGTNLAQMFYNSGLEADLTGATSVSVNDVREAFALQRYQEARALFGTRYTEYLRYLGVRSSDARLQRPEYLGGGKQTIAFTEVLQTAPTTSGAEAGIADMKGHGIAALRSNRYQRFFEEHGVVMTLLSVRPRTMYAEHLARMWLRTTKEDFYQRELETIGQQEILRREVAAEAGAGGDTVFGFTDRYSDYRHEQSSVAGEFRSTLNDWHLARSFAAPPTLNQSFVECTPSKRIHLDQSGSDVLWCMVNHSIQARRPVRHNSVGRIL